MPWDINIMDMLLIGKREDEKLKRELANKNYLNIHQKRRKK